MHSRICSLQIFKRESNKFLLWMHSSLAQLFLNAGLFKFKIMITSVWQERGRVLGNIQRDNLKKKKILTISSEFTSLCVARSTSLYSGTPWVTSVKQRIKFSFIFPRQATCFKSVSHQSLIFKNLLFLFIATSVTWECHVPYILGFLVLFVFGFSCGGTTYILSRFSWQQSARWSQGIS